MRLASWTVGIGRVHFTLALAVAAFACRAQAPAKPCEAVMLGACVQRPAALPACERGRARSLDDGSCVTSRDVRDLARAAGVFVDETDTVECEAKSDELVSSARLGKIGCITRDAPPPPCPARTVREGASCAPLEVGATVDLARWGRAAAAEICARLLRSPLVLAEPGGAKLEIELVASVPNNDLTQGFVRVRTHPPVPSEDLERAVAVVDDALRHLGGTASSTDLLTAVACAGVARRPISLP